MTSMHESADVMPGLVRCDPAWVAHAVSDATLDGHSREAPSPATLEARRPAVRAAAVYELGPDEAEALQALAREDAEARVRRAAVTRLDDVACSARSRGPTRTRTCAPRPCAAWPGSPPKPTSVDARGRGRPAAARARAHAGSRASWRARARAPHVRAAVVDLIDDPKALGVDQPPRAGRRDAAARARAPHRSGGDARTSRSSRSTPTRPWRRSSGSTIAEALSAIAQRARNKVAARRARTKLRAARGGGAARRARRRSRMTRRGPRSARSTCCIGPKRLVAMADPDEAAASLAATCAWRGPSPGRRRGRGRARAAVRAAQRRRARGDRRAAAGARGRSRSARSAIAREQADRLAIVRGDRAAVGRRVRVDRIAELKVQWDALPPMPSEYAASLTRRFQDACRAFEDRERRRMLAEAAVGRLETLATELEQLAGVGSAGRRDRGALARPAPRRRRAARARGRESRGRRAARARGRGARARRSSEHQQRRVQAGAGQPAAPAAAVPPGRDARCQPSRSR